MTSTSGLKTVADVKQLLSKQYAANKGDWLGGDLSKFPLKLSLMLKPDPNNFRGFLAFVQDWRGWSGPGVVTWKDIRSQLMGAQTVPRYFELSSPEQVAQLLACEAEWTDLKKLVHDVAQVISKPIDSVARQLKALTALPDDQRPLLLACLTYFVNESTAGLYLRQIPIEGLDTKWVETYKSSLVPLLQVAFDSAESDLDALLGLASKPRMVRVRLLCPTLRASCAGLSDLTIPVEQLATWELKPTLALVVENLASGLALQDMDGAIAIIGMGASVTMLKHVQWLSTIPVLYWGDIDTYGFNILGTLKDKLPHVEAILMDQATFDRHEHLAVVEPKLAPRAAVAATEMARMLYDSPSYQGKRLEQERLPWDYVQATLNSKRGAIPHVDIPCTA